jgi:hypothetical protein
MHAHNFVAEKIIHIIIVREKYVRQGKVMYITRR